MYVTPEMIEEARRLDLLSYLKSYEPQELVKCGSGEYCTREHDSLKISHGKWFWWSKGIGGVSALDFLIKVRGNDFITAVETLSGKAAIMKPMTTEKPKEKFKSLFVPRHNHECKTVRKYLEKRGIDDEIIDFYIAMELIGEDSENGYALFFGNDESGTHKQCSVRATDGKMFKKDVAGSDRNYSFHSDSVSGSTTLRVFESAIDMMSFATLMKRAGRNFRGENLMSLSGVYMPNKNLSESKVPIALLRILEMNPSINTVYLHLDNDRAGSEGSKGIIAVLGDKYRIKYVPPEAEKDFNDFLLAELYRENERKRIEKEGIER